MGEKASAVRINRSVRKQEIVTHNDGFLEGVCHVLDELHAAGYYDAYEAMLARLFTKREAARS